MDERPTTLYRAFDIFGRLLYVGIAYDWGHRWSRHRSRSPWFGQVVRVELEEHPTRTAAAMAEATAVAEEHPLHNVEHTSRDRRPWRQREDRPKLHVTPFDHAQIHRSAEYAAAYAAIDNLANADLGLGSQEALVQLVAEMARSVPYGDCCDRCMDAPGEDLFERSLAYPVGVEVRGQFLTATYRHHCGAVWTCQWAIDTPILAP